MTDENKKSPFKKEIFDTVFPMLCKLSDDQIDPDLREKIVEFTWNEHTAQEVYDFADSIAQAAFHGKASSFVMNVCNVQRFYERPS